MNFEAKKALWKQRLNGKRIWIKKSNISEASIVRPRKKWIFWRQKIQIFVEHLFWNFPCQKPNRPFRMCGKCVRLLILCLTLYERLQQVAIPVLWQRKAIKMCNKWIYMWLQNIYLLLWCILYGYRNALTPKQQQHHHRQQQQQPQKRTFFSFVVKEWRNFVKQIMTWDW